MSTRMLASSQPSLDELRSLIEGTFYFDEHWYLKINSVEAKPQDAFDHYLEYGFNLNLSPSPYLQPDWYLEKYPDVRHSRINPVWHFLKKGLVEKRYSSPFFQDGQLRVQQEQAYKLISSSRLFDPKFYYLKYRDVAEANVDPLRHYLSSGAIEGRQPHPLFNQRYYGSIQSDVARFNWNPLLHFLFIGGKKNASPHQLFDAGWYEQYYTLSSEIGTSFEDFLFNSGIRNPNEYFNVKWYLDSYSGSRDYPGGALAHYCDIGVLEGCDPSPAFSTKGYLEANMDVRASRSNPLAHFLKNGRAEGRSPKPTKPTNSVQLFRVGVPEYGAIKHIFRFEGPQYRPFKIAVHLHLFYIELGEELACYIANIPIAFDLFISVPDSVRDLKKIERLFIRHLPNMSKIVVWNVENRGRDVAPLIVDLAPELNRYDLICHFHSKKSHHNSSHSDWRRFLCHHILGSRSIVEGILHQFHSESGLALLQPPYHGALRSQPNWGRNRKVVDDALEKVGVPFAGEECPDYPAGSFFWVRPEAIQPILDGGFSRDDFQAEEGQVDGTLAHALERLFGIVPLTLGYHTAIFAVDIAFNLVNYYHPQRVLPRLHEDRTEDVKRYRAMRGEDVTFRRRSVAVCTAIFGKFDRLIVPEVIESDVDYFCVSDQSISGHGVFTIISADYLDPDPRRSARYVKTHLSSYVAGYDFVFWVDANVVIATELTPFLDALVDGTALAAIRHPFRESCFDEAAICKQMGLDEAELIDAQIKRYLEIPELAQDHLIETNLFCYDNHDVSVKEMFRIWWNEINYFSKRDQISINYAIRRSQVRWEALFGEKKSLRDSSGFALLEHGLGKWPGQRLVAGGWYSPANMTLFPEIDRAATLIRPKVRVDGGRLSIDVVVCVHNALIDVKACLSSLEVSEGVSLNVIIVNDCSDVETTEFLRDFAADRDTVLLLESDERLGYTKAVNIGVGKCFSDIVFLLNSDTICPAGVLGRLATVLASSENLGVVGPLSNAASFQSVPDVRGSSGQTAINPLPEGVPIEGIDRFVREKWNGVVPLTPLVHGFCLCVKREVFAKVGMFDEDAFPFGYGEENDFCFRTMDAGYDLGVATCAYVYHAKSKSYTKDDREKYMALGSERLIERYGRHRLKSAVAFMLENPHLVAVREMVGAEFYGYAERGTG